MSGKFLKISSGVITEDTAAVVSDIAVDDNLSSEAQAAITAYHAAVTLGATNDPQLALSTQQITFTKKVRRLWFGA
jgi:hypothetical protein